MPRVFEGLVFVSYSQAYVQVPGADMSGMEETFAGQVNGLCGAAAAGVLFLITGLHTGQVPFAVDVFASEPPLADGWEDVVEVSFLANEPQVLLLGWGSGSVDQIELSAPGWYRVRYCGRGMDAARDTLLDDCPELDSYLLQFWPGPPRSDAVVRQQSAIAAYWHEYARQLPPLPLPSNAPPRNRLQRTIPGGSASLPRKDLSGSGGAAVRRRIACACSAETCSELPERTGICSTDSTGSTSRPNARRRAGLRAAPSSWPSWTAWIGSGRRSMRWTEAIGHQRRSPAWTRPTLVSAAMQPSPTSPWHCAKTHQHHPE